MLGRSSFGASKNLYGKVMLLIKTVAGVDSQSRRDIRLFDWSVGSSIDRSREREREREGVCVVGRHGEKPKAQVKHHFTSRHGRRPHHVSKDKMDCLYATMNYRNSVAVGQ